VIPMRACRGAEPICIIDSSPEIGGKGVDRELRGWGYSLRTTQFQQHQRLLAAASSFQKARARTPGPAWTPMMGVNSVR